MGKEEALTENQKLNGIIQAYVDIWADVILNKNLAVHLKKIKEDLNHINRVIKRRKTQELDVLSYCRIAYQLFRLQKIVSDKLEELSQ